MNNEFDTAYLTNDQMMKIRFVIDELKRSLGIIKDAKLLESKKGNLSESFKSAFQIDERIGTIEEYSKYANIIDDNILKKCSIYLEMLTEIFEIEENHRKKIASIMDEKQTRINSTVNMIHDDLTEERVGFNDSVAIQVNYENKIYAYQKKHGFKYYHIGNPLSFEKIRRVKEIRKIVKKNFPEFVANLNDYYTYASNEQPVKLELLLAIVDQVSLKNSFHK